MEVLGGTRGEVTVVIDPGRGGRRPNSVTTYILPVRPGPSCLSSSPCLPG